MYIDMSSQKLTVPMDAEGKLALNFSRNHRRMDSWKIMILTAVALLVTVNICLLVATVLTLVRVKVLEDEMSLFKISVNEMNQFQNEIMNSIVGPENDEFYEDMDEETSEGDVNVKLDYPEYILDLDYYYDQPNETKELREIVESALKGENVTKQENESSRTKRNVLPATEDRGVFHSKSYTERKAKNTTGWNLASRGHSNTTLNTSTSLDGSPWDNSEGFNSEGSISTNRSMTHKTNTFKRTRLPFNVKHHLDQKTPRQALKKSFLKSGDSFNEEATSSPDFVVVRDFGRRRYRQRNLPLENLDEGRTRMGRAKLPAIHYNGDTSKYIVGQHSNFNGNGHMRHPQRTFIDWKVSDWAVSAGMDDYFTMDEGVLTIKESGIYFIYAQIYYLDEHDTTGFRVHKNRDTIFQCTITIHAREKRLIGNTCYTAGVEYLSEGDTISLADITHGRYSLFEPGKSFFGLIKLSDMKISSL